MSSTETDYAEARQAEMERRIAYLEGELVASRRTAARIQSQRDELVARLYDVTRELREARDIAAGVKGGG